MPPFIRLLLPVVAGILLAKTGRLLVPPLLCMAASIILVLIGSIWLTQRRRRAFTDIVLTLLFYLFILLCANSRYAFVSQEDRALKLYKQWQGQSPVWVAEVHTSPIKKQHYTQLEVQLLAWRNEEGRWPMPERPCTVLLRLKDTLQLQIGDRLLLQSRLTTFSPPALPGDFDYRAYMHSQNIFLSSWVPQGACLRFGVSPNRWQRMRRYMAAWQAKLRNALSQAGLEQSTGVLMALSLGDKSFLEQDVKQLYADTGASHVLAVSGLHVGILFLLMQWIWQPARRPARRWLFMLTTLPVLWCYALLTGGSPSVLRAALMFSLFSVAACINRTTNPYNTLALSAFLLLLLNPLLLFRLSFQLSYLAVLGILFFYPRLSSLWKPRLGFLKKTYELLCVSVAAQLTTLPLTLLYFKQFPLASLPSSLLVVPPAPFLLLTSFVLALLMLLHAPAWAVTLPAKMLLFVQTFIENGLELLRACLPPVNMQYWHVADSWIAYALLLLFVLYVTQEVSHRRWLTCSSMLLTLGIAYNIYEQHKLHQEKRVYVWYNPRHKHCEIGLVKGQQAWNSDESWCKRASVWRLAWNHKVIGVVNMAVDTARLWEKPPDIIVWNTYYRMPKRYVRACKIIVLGHRVGKRQKSSLLQNPYQVHDLAGQGMWFVSENSPIE